MRDMPLHDDRCIRTPDMQKQKTHTHTRNCILAGTCVEVFYVSTPSSLPQVFFLVAA